MHLDEAALICTAASPRVRHEGTTQDGTLRGGASAVEGIAGTWVMGGTTAHQTPPTKRSAPASGGVAAGSWPAVWG
jgi:hypothetical protein